MEGADAAWADVAERLWWERRGLGLLSTDLLNMNEEEPLKG